MSAAVFASSPNENAGTIAHAINFGLHREPSIVSRCRIEPLPHAPTRTGNRVAYKALHVVGDRCEA